MVIFFIVLEFHDMTKVCSVVFCFWMCVRVVTNTTQSQRTETQTGPCRPVDPKICTNTQPHLPLTISTATNQKPGNEPGNRK